MYRSIVLVVLALASTSVAAQVSLSALDVTVTQNFDTLPSSGTITVTSNVTPIPGWYYVRTGTGMTMVADTGTGTGGNLYSYGSAGQADRALGSLGSGNATAGNFFWGVRLLNNTGGTITSLDISFTGEQWRNGAAAAQTIAFSYLAGSPAVTGSLAEFQSAGTAVAALDFTSPVTGGTAGALNGNLTANRVPRSATISGLNIPNGSEIMLRWSDPDHAGADHGLSIDDFSVTPHGTPSCTVNPVVANTADGGLGSLRNAVATACANSTVTFSAATFATPQTITLTTGEIALPVNLTITGPGADLLTLSGNNNSRILYMNGINASISGIRFTAGNGSGLSPSGYGGAMISLGGSLSLSDCVFIANNAVTTGSVLALAFGTLSVIRSEFAGNVGANVSGAYIQDASATISDSLFANNTGGNGDVIRLSITSGDTGVRTLSLSNSTFSGNTVGTGISVLRVQSSSADAPIVNLINNTIVGNTSVGAGSTIGVDGSGPTPVIRMTNSIVVGNTANGAAADIAVNLDPASSHNLIGIGGGLIDGTNNNRVGLSFADALLSPLGSHGGSLRTHALLPGSPAIDAGLAGAAPISDMRNVTRPQLGGVDIGSFETRGFNLSLTGGNSQTAIIDTAFALPLTVSVAAIDVTDPIDGGRIRFTAPGAGASASLATSPAAISAGSAEVAATANSLVGSYSVAATTDGNSGAPIAFALINGAPQSDLSVTKTDGVTSVTAGGSTTYTIVASNAGPSNAAGATISDTLPSSLTCTWTCAGAGGGTCTASGSGNINDTVNLPSGGSTTYTASCSVAASATGNLSNTVTIATPAGVTDPTPGNNAATDTNTIGSSADLAITKTDDVTSVTAGGNTTYTITASNAGPSNATGATISDTLPASLTCTWTCVGAGGGTCTAAGSGNINDTINLPSGGSTAYTASCSIAATATGTLVNTATIAAPAGTTDPTPGNNAATDTNTIGSSADLAITKTDGVTSVTAGGNTTYTITASNAGPSNATGATISDTLPSSLTCTWTCVGAGGGTCTAAGSGNINDTVNLPSGGSTTYTASCSIAASATGNLSNTATISAPAGTTDPTPGNNSATDTNTIGSSADLAINKTDGVTSVTAGGNTTYTITASNAGPSNATGATISDTLPSSLTCTWTCVGAGGGTCSASGSGNINDAVNLPAGGSTTYTASCSIAATATGTLSNTATITAPAGVTDPTPGNNSATDTNTIGSSADLAITKTDGVTSVTAGGNTTYTIVASNAGPSNAAGATISDTLPASLTCTWTCVGAGGGTCTASGSGNINDTINLPAGGSTTYTASCSIAATATGTLSNTATITAPAGTTDPTPGNNAATDTNTIGSSADLAITKTDGVTSVTAGGNTTYTITASNAGPSNATGATITDTLPSSLTCTWTCVGAGGGACTAAGSGNINDTINLPSGGSTTYTASCSIAASAAGTLSNTATITAPTGVTDPTPGNNSATDTNTVSAASSLQFSSASYTVLEGGGAATITVIATAPLQTTATVSYATSDGSAEAGSDYTATSGTLTFAAGETSLSFGVPITDDAIVEGDETITLTLSGVTGGAVLGTQSTATLTIVNDDSAAITVTAPSIVEGDAGTTSMSFEVTLSHAVQGAVSFNYATADGTATLADNDYQASSGIISFAAGSTTPQTVLVTIVGDTKVEPDETLLLNLTDLVLPADIATTGVTLQTSSIGTILNDDGVSISVSGGSAQEGTATGGTLALQVTLSAAVEMPVNVDYATTDGTAIAGVDYLATSGTLTFAPGETSKTIFVAIIPDRVPEHDKTVSLNLSNPQPTGVASLGTATALGTIIDDDIAVQLPVNDLRVLLLMLLLIGGFGGLALRRR